MKRLKEFLDWMLIVLFVISMMFFISLAHSNAPVMLPALSVMGLSLLISSDE